MLKHDEFASSMPVYRTQCSSDTVFSGCNLAPTDNRYDPIVGAAFQSLDAAVADDRSLRGASGPVGVVAITDNGCRTQIARVADALADNRPRQAFFARASAVMVATYCSMAIESHGPCLAISGGAPALVLGLAFSRQMLHSEQCERIILVAADNVESVLKSVVIPFQQDDLDGISTLLAHGQAYAGAPETSAEILSQWLDLMQAGTGPRDAPADTMPTSHRQPMPRHADQGATR